MDGNIQGAFIKTQEDIDALNLMMQDLNTPVEIKERVSKIAKRILRIKPEVRKLAEKRNVK
jgi:hypothetical protein